MYFYVLTAILVSASYQLTLTFLSLEHVASRRSSGEKAQQSTSSSWAWISVSFSPEVLLNTWEQRCDDGSYTTVRILLYLLFSCGNYSRFRYLNLKVDHFGGNDPLMIISLHFCRNINTITKDSAHTTLCISSGCSLSFILVNILQQKWTAFQIFQYLVSMETIWPS